MMWQKNKINRIIENAFSHADYNIKLQVGTINGKHERAMYIYFVVVVFGK